MPIPIVFLPEKTLFTFGDNNSDITLASSPNGRLLVGYTEVASAGDPNFGITVPTLAPPADIGSTATLIAGSAAIDEQQGSFAVSNDGFFSAAAWTERDDATGNFDIYATVEVNGFFGSHNVFAPRFLVNAGAQTGIQDRPEIFAFGNDAFGVTWLDHNTLRLNFATFGADGQSFLAPVALSTSNVTNSSVRYGVAELETGTAVVAYRNDAGDDKFRIVFSNSLVTGELDVDGVSGANGAIGVAALPGIGFVTAFVGSDGHIDGRVFNSSGIALTGVFDIMSNSGGAIDLPRVAALSDGRFMVVAQQGGDIVARMMHSDGTPDSSQFAVNDITAGTQSVPQVETLADGRIAVAWQTDQNTAGIEYTVFDPRLAGITLSGTASGDNYVGTAFDDTLAGGNGSDHLVGGAGNDTLIGGPGGDSFDGGTGSDILIGGLGNDGVAGGAGNDTFRFDSPNEGSDGIQDFQRGQDHILLGSNFVSEGGGPHPLSSNLHFEYGTTATTSSPTVLFDTFHSHQVEWDSDGTGPAATQSLAFLQFADASDVSEPDQRSISLPGLNGYSVLGTGDFNHHGGVDSDIVLRNNASGAAEIWFMGGGAIIGDFPIGNLAGYSLAGTGDFNHDGADDMLWRNNTSGVVESWLMQDGVRVGDSVLGNLTGYTALGTGDFNQDGNTDIVWQNNTSGAADIWFMGGGHVIGDYNLGNLTGYSLLGIGDFNGDHTADLVWRNNTTGLTETWQMQQGVRTGGVTLGNLAGYQLLDTGDLNHDGTDDLVWRDMNGNASTWAMRGGQFQNDTENLFSIPLGGVAVGSGDFTGDGGKDVLFTNAATNTTTIVDIEHHSLAASDFLIV